MERPDWSVYFMQIAQTVATRSTCLRRQVGAVLVHKRHILATGYNGAPAGLPHCSDTGCVRQQQNVPPGQRHELCRGLHAEQNALIQAAKHGVVISHSWLYCTHAPCAICAKMLLNAEIAGVVYEHGYPDTLARQLFEAGQVALWPLGDVSGD